MEEFRNPFEYDAAANLPSDMLKEVYIEDYNHSRFILSNRNIYLLGERGSGKSMMLLYNSFKIKSTDNEGIEDLDYVGIHIPCKQPLFLKSEHELCNDEVKAKLLSEHYLV